MGVTAVRGNSLQSAQGKQNRCYTEHKTGMKTRGLRQMKQSGY
jgi:hypothetical protein